VSDDAYLADLADERVKSMHSHRECELAGCFDRYLYGLPWSDEYLARCNAAMVQRMREDGLGYLADRGWRRAINGTLYLTSAGNQVAVRSQHQGADVEITGWTGWGLSAISWDDIVRRPMEYRAECGEQKSEWLPEIGDAVAVAEAWLAGQGLT